jgi:hypothetical protein
MANDKNTPGRLTEAAQRSLVDYTMAAAARHKRRNEMFNKMEWIDVAYARYNATLESTNGVDIAAANVVCGIGLEDVQVPIVISQVDSFVGYLADVFLSGYPIFPVVSTPATKNDAAKLQGIIDTHATLGAYPRQILKFLRDCVKYNIGCLELDWSPIDRYSVVADMKKPLDQAKVDKAQDHYNRIKRIDPYNLIRDDRTEDMADGPYCGELMGYVELVSRIELMRLANYLETTEYGYNTSKAFINGITTSVVGDGINNFYRQRPQISSTISARNNPSMNDVNFWEHWLNSQPHRQGRQVSGMYEIIKLYARIVPKEHGISAPNADEPQIYQIRVVNGQKLLSAKRIISAYDTLPMYIGQPIEDGFAEQTQSIAENQIPYQNAGNKFINIRFNSARRAVSDRAIYDQDAISSDNINSPVPAAKIPFKKNSLIGGKTIDSIYKQIPFDPRGTEGVIQDMAEMYSMAGKLSGLNKPQQGEFQKGNKSVKEWNDTMAGSDNRLRLPALCLEYQVFMPLKEQLKLNIYQYGPTGIFYDYKSNSTIPVEQKDIDALRNTVLYFKIADGSIPSSKLASTESIGLGLQMLQQSPFLQQQLGPMIVPMFTHLMQLMGVQGLEEYMPQQGTVPATSQPAAQAATLPGVV